jgi:hypothetical protein
MQTSIVIPIEFLLRLRNPLSWNDLKYAYERGIVKSKTVIDFACEAACRDSQSSADLISLANCHPSESISEKLLRIASTESKDQPEQEKRWALILACYVGENKLVEDPLSLVEEIYADFGYPKELAPFVRYMPLNGPDLGSVQANENRMFDALKNFSSSIVASSLNDRS